MTEDELRLNQLRDQLGVVHVSQVEPPDEHERWLIPGIVCSTNTLLFGTASAGKSLTVAHLIASLTDGREFLGIEPNVHGLKVLILCTDRGAEQEYKERFCSLGVDPDVEFIPGVAVQPQHRWSETHELAQLAGVDLVVVDHASGVLDGDEIEKQPWRELWTQRIAPFDCPVILVAHASDYSGERGRSHRVMGNSAAAQFARCEVEIYATGASRFTNSARVLRTASRYGDGIERRFRISDTGLIVRDEQAEVQSEERARNRAQETMDTNHRLAHLAVQSRGQTIKAVAEDIASRTGESASTLSKRKLPDLVKSGLLSKSDDQTRGMYAPGPALAAV